MCLLHLDSEIASGDKKTQKEIASILFFYPVLRKKSRGCVQPQHSVTRIEISLPTRTMR